MNKKVIDEKSRATFFVSPGIKGGQNEFVC